MTGPPPATAAVRLAVRRSLADWEGPAAAAVSGGADSLALAAALAFERPGSLAYVVDHQLQAGSDTVAAAAAEQCRSLGLAASVLASAEGDTNAARAAGRKANEAHARELRYALFEEAASASGATVLLGHTRDDQAETVLLGLVRGSGARALSGMAPVRDRYRRPFLDLPRATVRQACAEAGLEPHDDPHNEDEGYLRVSVRKLLSDLDVTDGLARSARLLRDDADALDALTEPTDDIAALEAMVPAVRSRAIKAWAEARTGRQLSAVHVEAVRALVEDWHGQGAVALPGGGRVVRDRGRLAFLP